MKDEILVSVYCTTYNHEDYISQALDSMLMQKVNFKYEIIVGEDCSTDHTRSILKQYEADFPGVFTMVYRDQNIGMKRNALDIISRCKGKYLAPLEGDDFWTDKYKLQRQVNFLEKHPEFIAVAHKVTVVNAKGRPNGERYPECGNKIYTLREYKKGQLPGQTASLLVRNFYDGTQFDASIIYDMSLEPGDRVGAFIYASHGGVYCMKNVMSAYRHILTGSSYSSLMKKENKKRSLKDVIFHRAILRYARESVRTPEAVKVAEELLFWYVTVAFLFRIENMGIRQWFYELCGLHYKLSCILYSFGRLLLVPYHRFILRYFPKFL